jgi:hypothetical protein
MLHPTLRVIPAVWNFIRYLRHSSSFGVVILETRVYGLRFHDRRASQREIF